MCLDYVYTIEQDAVKHFKDLREKNDLTVYKVFYRKLVAEVEPIDMETFSPDEPTVVDAKKVTKYYAPYHGIGGVSMGETVECNKNHKIRSNRFLKVSWYPAGFHCYLNFRDAQLFCSMLNHLSYKPINADAVIVEIEVNEDSVQAVGVERMQGYPISDKEPPKPNVVVCKEYTMRKDHGYA